MLSNAAIISAIFMLVGSGGFFVWGLASSSLAAALIPSSIGMFVGGLLLLIAVKAMDTLVEIYEELKLMR